MLPKLYIMLIVFVLVLVYSVRANNHDHVFKQGNALHFKHHLAHDCMEKVRHKVVNCIRDSGLTFDETDRQQACCYLWIAQDCARQEAKHTCTSLEKRAVEENVWNNIHRYNEDYCDLYHYHKITCSNAPTMITLSIWAVWLSLSVLLIIKFF
ncbi:unnamed protein product [Oppiella nova]|uniref:Uncharacterized protein n=1 Tax=Oppiella nova TaxID=334625 RepID=A0A7R9QJA0_9ACAR|nr:unnamed protein product [Oppiella nova]CAG2166109.1 unnamed protein product [Oppiella nova]